MNSPATPEEMVSSGVLAKAAGLHCTTIGRLCRSGIIRGTRIPGSKRSRWRISKSEAARFLKALEVPS